MNIEPTPDQEEALEKLFEELAKDCMCMPLENRPCDGLLAGGPCDCLHMGKDVECDY